MFKWIVIGGGIQGATVASHLLHFNLVNQEEILVIDPHDSPVEEWKRVTNKVGMKHLRSPSVHHLHPDPYHLKKFAKIQQYRSGFKGKFQRPLLNMFNDHCQQWIKEVNLHLSWKKGTVCTLQHSDSIWNVQVASGESFQAQNVVLAIGINDQPLWPEWAKELKDSQIHNISHVFEYNDLPTKGDVAVIGGGMSAAHTAIQLAKHTDVTLIKRHPIRLHDFDSDPGWLGPKYLTDYDKISCNIERRSLINNARYKGSLTRDLHVELQILMKRNKLSLITSEIYSLSSTGDRVRIQLENEEQVDVASVVLATGSVKRLPGEKWLSKAIKNHQLPIAPCGFPVVDEYLKWSEGLYVTGALSELRIGPVARNIAGARKAAERISRAALGLEMMQ